jgi:hypothetical protein
LVDKRRERSEREIETEKADLKRRERERRQK